uniref:Apple domain-containing protein n=1 Tax=Clytia hemisphaerica TaxID=252671 RepID=A0A7M5V561_9CNID
RQQGLLKEKIVFWYLKKCEAEKIMRLDTQYTLFFTILIICITVGYSHVLQLKQCRNFDAEFSKITYGQRLLGDIFKTLDSISLRRCLTKCLYYMGCLSVNYMRTNQICEILGNSLQRNSSAALSSNETWNHFETNYDRKTIGISCFKSNPCPADKRCVDNCDGLTTCVSITVESLRGHLTTITASTESPSWGSASKAFDGSETSQWHTQGGASQKHWIKTCETITWTSLLAYLLAVHKIVIYGLQTQVI